MKMILRSLTILVLIINFVNANNDEWDFHLWLDPYLKYSLKWKVNHEEEIITFLAEVKTKGWIGFGISPNGGMKSSDIVIGWVDDTNGKAYFHDRYASDETLPEIDESQDWLLLDSKQNSTHTIMKFSRPYTTCDKEKDLKITRDTTRLIYAYNDIDPKSPNEMKLHGRYERGSKSALLLTLTEKIGTKPKETDLKDITLVMDNLTMPAKDTTYWCKLFKLPERKIHVVQFESVITPGNEPFTHHISLQACNHPDFSVLAKHIGTEGADCTDFVNMPKDFKHCTTPFFLWAVGGSPLTFPDEIGFPLGDEPSTTHLLLTVHYDNPYLISNRTDSSGFKFYYTENFRKHEAYTISVGTAVDKRMFIPPAMKRFSYSSHCHPDCYREYIPDDGLKVFAVRSHAHLAGREIKTRVFRGNKELPWIENDRGYDFNMQQYRTLDPFYIIHKGDQITTECIYDTSDRNQTVFGGPASRQEMCLSVLFYYPRMLNTKTCFSSLSMQGMMELAGVDDVISKSEFNVTIQSPKHLRNQDFFEYLLDKKDWNKKILNDSHEFFLRHKQKAQCYWTKTESDNEINELIGYPDLDYIYDIPEKSCIQTNSISVEKTKTGPNSMTYIFIGIILMNILLIVLVMIIVFRSKIIIQFKRF